MEPSAICKPNKRIRKAYISRTESFSSAHRLHSKQLSAEKNKEVQRSSYGYSEHSAASVFLARVHCRECWSFSVIFFVGSKVFSKCNNIHGHNYKITVTVYGEIDPITGMVMDISKLKLIMKEYVLDNLDHKYIDEEVAYFEDVVSTTENVAVYCWEQMQIGLGETSSSVYEVHIFETDKNGVKYRGE
eukprot:m.109313 g.109313  ORF g.109313 m.109313 type:complete len:188 (-) comp27945_c0_seq2:50-613(-)